VQYPFRFRSCGEVFQLDFRSDSDQECRSYKPIEASLGLLTDENDAARYGSGAIAFHWLMFLLVIGVGILGLLHDSWPKRTQAFWINVHAMLGLLLWVALIARLSWRLRHAPPPLPREVSGFPRRVSTRVHWGLYALMFITPVVGVVTFVWHGRIFDFGLFRLDPGIRSNRAIFETTEDIHGYLAYGLFALAGMHALAALWHQFVIRDGILRRMWPR
jgi:cytochrome b561